MDGHYTTQEVANITGLNISRIRQLLADNVIIGVKRAGSPGWWIPQSQIAVIKARRDGRGGDRRSKNFKKKEKVRVR